MSVSGWMTTANDVDRAVAAVRRCLENPAGDAGRP